MFKKLIEKRNLLLEEAEKLLAKSEEETRALTEDELKRYNECLEEVRSIDKTLEASKANEGLEASKPAGAAETTEEAEIREFATLVRTYNTNAAEFETRDATNFGGNTNGAIIPQSIAKMVIKAVTNLCPIFAGATVFHYKGTLKIPVYGANNGDDVTAAYSEDFVQLTSHAGKFTSVDLGGYLIGALSLIGRSLINSTDLDLTNFVVGVMAEKIAQFIEHELLIGTSGKCTGALSTSNTVTTASTSALTGDELIYLQSLVNQAYQKDACWTMHPKTFSAIQTLRDGNGRYLLQDDITREFPYRLLGKPVYLSDNMPQIGAGSTAVLYGDYKGLAVNINENLSIEVLRERYADQHAIGIISWLSLDSKVMDAQKLAVLKMSATS